MTREEIIKILENATCNDACECLFDLYGTDEEYNGICKATEPPCDAWGEKDGCPLCKQIAELLKEQREIVRCKDCKHRPKKPEREDYESGFDIEFPDGKCPCQCSGDEWYSWYPEDDWFCAEGERK